MGYPHPGTKGALTSTMRLRHFPVGGTNPHGQERRLHTPQAQEIPWELSGLESSTFSHANHLRFLKANYCFTEQIYEGRDRAHWSSVIDTRAPTGGTAVGCGEVRLQSAVGDVNHRLAGLTCRSGGISHRPAGLACCKENEVDLVVGI